MEPLGVVVFSVVMITSFSQILVESVERLFDKNLSIPSLPMTAIVTMAVTVVVKSAVWLTYRNFESTSIKGKKSMSIRFDSKGVEPICCSGFQHSLKMRRTMLSSISFPSYSP